MEITNERITFLKDFLSYKRKEGSTGQYAFTETYLNLDGVHLTEDGAGNIHVDLRTDTKHRTLFVAHTDTVHRSDGMQTVKFDDATAMLMLDDIDSNCLGADDGAGVLVLLHLIKNRVPAYYVFTRAEECGGAGAKYLATTLQKEQEFLSEFNRAIAFDRRGTSSVITHQAWGRCCSDTFADALCDALGTDQMMYAPDNTGVYTDTAEFVSNISECTNISVGYYDEHTSKERLDVSHLFALMDRVVQIDWDNLPTERDPSKREVEAWDRWDNCDNWSFSSKNGHQSKSTTHKTGYQLADYDWFEDYVQDSIFDAIRDAYDGYHDELLWLTAEALVPEEPEIIYNRIRHVKPSKETLKQLSRSVNYDSTTHELISALSVFYTNLQEDVLAINNIDLFH